jgi:preprotein translocase subunit SecG
MTKVSFFDRRVFENFLKVTSAISATLSLIVLFVDIPKNCKTIYGWIFLGLLVVIYFVIWIWSNKLNKIDIKVEGSDVTISTFGVVDLP